MTLKQRQAELEALGWRDIKAIAEPLGIDKPEDGTWEDTISDILKHEFPPPPVEPTEPVPTVPTPQAAPLVEPSEAPVYTTDFYKATRISTCPQCGDKRRTGVDGQLICPIESNSCPVLKGT